jgi:c-di-GMP-related signal transduction protein
MGDTPFFLGRRPIVDARGELAAYELLFRSIHKNKATVFDDIEASQKVIDYALTDLDIVSALAGKPGFISVSQALLMSDVIKMLPEQGIVLEIPETVEFTPEVASRCRELHQSGYTLALDHVVTLTESQLAVLPFISVVKIDVPAQYRDNLKALAQQSRLYGAQLLADKIDTRLEYDFCRHVRFDLYQGYFFARPVILPRRVVQSSSLVLLKLMSLISRDAELEELEDTLKHAPDLTMRLLRTVNSAALSRPLKIDSVKDAILLLGRATLSRLVQITMFAQQSRRDARADPVTQLALIRGRLMETVAQLLDWSSAADRAFMVGMLSLVDTLFGQELSEIITLLNLEENVTQALLHRDGKLGLLLQLAEASELEDSGRVAVLADALGLHDLDAFNRIQIDALRWASSV